MADETKVEASVAVPHPLYTMALPNWEKVRTVVKGEDAVKAAGAVYLPSLSGQADAEYASYKDRALFMDGTRRTLDGFCGMVFRIDPEINANESVKEGWLMECVRGEKDLGCLLRESFREVMIGYRYGVLLDMYTDGTPYLCGYQSEDIINWACEEDKDGYENLKLVVLRECFYQPDGSMFGYRKVEQYRELRLLTAEEFEKRQTESGLPALVVPSGVMEGYAPADPFYAVFVWIKKEKEPAQPGTKEAPDEYVIKEIVLPQVRGMRIPYIPFCVISATGEEDYGAPDMTSPLSAIANVNLSWYRSSADLEHGRHFCGLPTPWVAGFKLDPGKSLRIGSGVAWVSDDPNAKVGMLEFTGQGLQALEKALEQKLQLMALLGARMLEEPKKAVEATETHKLRRAGEESIVASVAHAVGDGIDVVLAWAVMWDPTLGAEITVNLNDDYGVQFIDPTKIEALLKAVLADKLSTETFLENLAAGGVLPEGRTVEDELDLIAAHAPPEPAPLPEGTKPEDELEDEEEEEEETV